MKLLKIIFLLFIFCFLMRGMELEEIQTNYLNAIPEELRTEAASMAFYHALQFWAAHIQQITDANYPSQKEIILPLPLAGPPQSVDLNPIFPLAAFCYHDGTIQIWNNQGELLQTLHAPDIPLSFIKFSPNGTLLIASSNTKHSIWDVETGAMISLIETEPGAPLCFSPDNRFIAIRTLGKSITFTININIWNIATGQLALSLPYRKEIYISTFTPDSQFLLAGDQDGQYRTYNINSGQLVEERIISGSIKFSPDGKLLALVSSMGIELLALASSNINKIPVKDNFFFETFSPDGKCIAIMYHRGFTEYIEIWDTTYGRLLYTLYDLKRPSSSSKIQFSDNNRVITTASLYDHSIRTIQLYNDAALKKIINLSFREKLVLNDLYLAYLNNHYFDLPLQSEAWQFLNSLDVALKKAINRLQLVIPALDENSSTLQNLVPYPELAITEQELEEFYHQPPT